MDAAPLVGRSAEAAAVRSAVAKAAVGAGGVLLVLGEAGVGKSRLLAEATQAARACRMHILAGRAAESGGAYRPLAEALLRSGAEELNPDALPRLAPYRAALGHLLPSWASGETVEAEPRVDPVLVLGEGVIRLLDALGGGTGFLVLLEDLHWADADTLALLEYLADRLHDLPLLVAASARDDEPGASAGSRLAAVPGVRSLRLSRLGGMDLAALADERSHGRLGPDEVAAVVARADGLPLLVEELVDEAVRAGDGTNKGRDAAPPPFAVPGTMAALVFRRLALLDPIQQHCLTVAAVASTEPEWELLPTVLELPAEAVMAAARAGANAGLLYDDGVQLRWRHALTREAVLASRLSPERVELARRVAEALLVRGRPEDTTRAAELFAAGGERERAAALFLDLARQDREGGALRRAEQLLDRALSAGASPEGVAIERVALHTATGQVGDALDVGIAALPSATGEVHAELCLRLARTAVLARRWADAQAYVERAGRPDDPRSLLLLADAAFGAGDVARAGGLAGAAVERAERLRRPAVLCEALDIAGRVARLGNREEARAAFARAAQVASEHRLLPQRVAALIGLGTVELLEGETSDALPQARDLAVTAGLLGQASAAEVVLFDQVVVERGPQAVEAAARVLLEQGERLRLPEVHAASALAIGLARAAAGDRAGMEAALDRVPQTSGWPEASALASAVRALPPLLASDLVSANALLDAAMTTLAAHRSAAPLHHFGLWALVRTAIDDRGEAAREVLRTLPAALRPANRGALHYADAIAAGRDGRPADAVAHLQAGDADLARLEWLHRLLRLPVLEAAVVDGWGDPVPLLRQHLADYERDGEHQLARTCRDLLKRAGSPTRRGRGTTPVPAALRAAGVTSREMDVLTLVSTGMTNAQIAARLYLSRRTVETHVASLLARLGAADRSELRSRGTAQTP